MNLSHFTDTCEIWSRFDKRMPPKMSQVRRRASEETKWVQLWRNLRQRSRADTILLQHRPTSAYPSLSLSFVSLPCSCRKKRKQTVLQRAMLLLFIRSSPVDRLVCPHRILTLAFVGSPASRARPFRALRSCPPSPLWNAVRSTRVARAATISESKSHVVPLRFLHARSRLSVPLFRFYSIRTMAKACDTFWKKELKYWNMFEDRNYYFSHSGTKFSKKKVFDYVSKSYFF